MDAPQSSPPRSGLPASLGLLAVLAGNLVAQAAVAISGNTLFYKEPGGVRLGALVAGASVAPGRRSGAFAEVVLDGWIFTASTRADPRDGFDLSVAPAEGENIRSEPNGAVVGRAVQGALFNRVSQRGGWTRVRRSVWVARNVLAARAESPGGPPPPRARDRVAADSVPSPPPPSAPPPADGRSPSAIVRAGTSLQRSPDGPAVARLEAPAEVGLGERRGEWVEVQLRGWVRRAAMDSGAVPRPAISSAMLRDDPERYVGQTVDWRVQFLALQQADELRPEMPLGQRYLLARGPLPESGFVYVMISQEQAQRLAGVSPLEELGVTVTVRAGRTRFLATPVVELVRRIP